MKKINVSIKMLAALLMAGAAMTACSNDDTIAEKQQPNNEVKTYNVVINASKGGDDTATRALAVDGTQIKATWTVGDEVIVRNNGESTNIGTLTVQSTSNGGTDAVLKGTITGSFTNGESKLDLHYCLVDNGLNSQNGTLTGTANSIDKVADYAKATVTVTDASTTNITTTNANFVNQRAILKLTITDEDAPLRKMNFSSFRAVMSSYSWGEMTSIPASTYTTNGDGVLYMAIAPFTSGNLYLSGNVNGAGFYYNKENVTIEAGKIYNINMKMHGDTSYPIELSAVTSTHVGYRLCNDGKVYTPTCNLPSGVTPVAIIAYVGAAGSVETGNSTYRGLAIALNDCQVSSEKIYSTPAYKFASAVIEEACVGYVNNLSDALNTKNGIAATNKLTTVCSGHTHPAAAAAKSNDGTAAPSGTSGWFLPSVGQWLLIAQGLSGSNQSFIVYPSGGPSGDKVTGIAADRINPKLIDFGQGLPELYGNQNTHYWTSTEYAYNESKHIVWNYHPGVGWVNHNYNSIGLSRVRAVLAF